MKLIQRILIKARWQYFVYSKLSRSAVPSLCLGFSSVLFQSRMSDYHQECRETPCGKSGCLTGFQNGKK